jgi:hypothetical protein
LSLAEGYAHYGNNRDEENKPAKQMEMSFHKSVGWERLGWLAQATENRGEGSSPGSKEQYAMLTALRIAAPIPDIAASTSFIVPPIEEELALKQGTRVRARLSRLSYTAAEMKPGNLSRAFLRKVARTCKSCLAPRLVRFLRKLRSTGFVPIMV